MSNSPIKRSRSQARAAKLRAREFLASRYELSHASFSPSSTSVGGSSVVSVFGDDFPCCAPNSVGHSATHLEHDSKDGSDSAISTIYEILWGNPAYI